MTLKKENNNIDFWVMIPARLKSTRFPEKMLANIMGKSMICRVVEKAMISGASRVIVATDSEKIKNAISTYNADCIMTSGDHPTGSDRICEALEKARAKPDQVIVNLQGDEPLISPDTVKHLAILKANCLEDVTTVVSKFESAEEIVSPNCVKVVTTEDDQALYFSRAMIPFDRDAGIVAPANSKESSYLKHIGIYSFYAGSLKEYVANGECNLEKLEKLEQLRWLWMGKKIKVLHDDFSGSTGIDTLEDLKRVESYLTKLKND